VRIGLVCPYSLSIPGGVQGQVLALARSLRRRGHEARVLAPCDGPPPELFVTPLGNSVPTASNGSIAPIAPDLPAQLRTIRALWDESFDVLHLHEPLVPGPTVTAALLKPAPLVGTFHAAGSQPAYQALAPLVAWLGNRLDVRVAVSDDALALVEGPVGGEFSVLFNGIEGERFRTAEPWPSPTPSILFLGRHEPRKGLEVLLRAVPELPAGVAVWVAGDGPQTAELRARHDDERIEWLGRIGDDERDRRMRAASVFCAPSLGGESFGVILLEAMAAGTPVVASSIPGYAKVAEAATAPAGAPGGPDGPPLDGRAALLVEPGDPHALATAIRRVLEDDGEVRRLRDVGVRRAAGFDLEVLCDRYLEIYRSVLSPGAVGSSL
jgi:phosphatidyl-myo-inositol alpha-mannosyltransferase